MMTMGFSSMTVGFSQSSYTANQALVFKCVKAKCVITQDITIHCDTELLHVQRHVSWWPIRHRDFVTVTGL